MMTTLTTFRVASDDAAPAQLVAVMRKDERIYVTFATTDTDSDGVMVSLLQLKYVTEQIREAIGV